MITEAMNRHLCFVVALLLSTMMMSPMSVSQAGEFVLRDSSGHNKDRSHGAAALNMSVFTHLKAEINPDHVEVSWHVNTRMDIAYFVVEKATAIRPFGFIGGLNVNKSVSPQESFHYSDLLKPSNETAVYRIKLVLADGQIVYSDAFKSEYPSLFSVYPDPVSDILTVTLPPLSTSPFHIRIFDQQGSPILTAAPDPKLGSQQQQVQLDLSNFPQGLYIISITGGRHLWHKRVLKL